MDNPVLPIHIFINGNGGSLLAGLCIYDFLVSISNPIIGYVNGNCHSAALIALAGCKSKRLCTPNSRFQYHAVRTTIDIKNVGQTEEDVQDLIVEAKHYAKRVAEINESSYGMPYDKFMLLSEKGERTGLPLLAEQAKEFGVIHEIVTELPFKFTV